jgi:branched-chain amino acid transport system substrate-binding protein
MPWSSRRRWALGAAIVTVAAVLTACGSGGGDAGNPDEPVKIAMVAHNTGPYADTGRLKAIGAQIAIDEINAAGGIQSLGGAKLELVTEDAGESVTTAVSAVNRALGEGVVAGEGTGISSTTLAVTEVAERREIPWITMSYEDKITERGFRNVFATSPKTSEFTDLWVKAITELAAAKGVSIQDVGIISGVNVVATSAAEQLRTTYAPANGWNIVMDQTVEEGTLRDATPVVEQIRSTGPQLLLVGSSIADLQLITRKEIEQGMTPVPWVLAGAPYLSGAFVEALGADAVNGTFAVASAAPFKDQEELAQKVRDAGDPFPQQYHFATYSHMYLIKDAIERAGSRDPQAIRDELSKTDVTGGPAGSPWPSGRVRFDETGRAVDRVAVLVQWQDGKTVTVYPVDRAQGDPIWPTLSGPTS